MSKFSFLKLRNNDCFMDINQYKMFCFICSTQITQFPWIQKLFQQNYPKKYAAKLTRCCLWVEITARVPGSDLSRSCGQPHQRRHSVPVSPCSGVHYPTITNTQPLTGPLSGQPGWTGTRTLGNVKSIYHLHCPQIFPSIPSLPSQTSHSTLGNEKADTAAKLALSLPVTRMKLPPTGMYPRITKLIFDEWQEVWNCCAGNKLHAIRPTVGGYKRKTCLSRRGSVLLNRLRFGHTRLMHSFLLSGDDIPECGTCQCPLTVKHILVECVDLNEVRNKHFVASSIKDLFDNIVAHKIIDFIKITRFYKQL